MELGPFSLQRSSQEARTEPVKSPRPTEKRGSDFYDHMRQAPAKKQEPSLSKAKKITHESPQSNGIPMIPQSQMDRTMPNIRYISKDEPSLEPIIYAEDQELTPILDPLAALSIVNFGGVPVEVPKELMKNVDVITYELTGNIDQTPPLLSILSGHIEQLIPQDIPKAILGNQFIQNALQSQNIGEFFSTPKPTMMLVEDMGLEVFPEQLAQLEQLGTFASPRDIFDALDLDSQNALTELKILKETLPIEGVSPYMIRSAALRAQGHHLNEEFSKAVPILVGPVNSPISIEDKISGSEIKANELPLVGTDLPKDVRSIPVTLESLRIMSEAYNDTQVPNKNSEIKSLTFTQELVNSKQTPEKASQERLFDSIAKARILDLDSFKQDMKTEAMEGQEPDFDDFQNKDSIGFSPDKIIMIDQGSDSSDRDSSSRDEQNPSDSTSENPNFMTIDRNHRTGPTFTTQVQAMAPKEPSNNELRNSLLEKAHMLASAGGGTVRMELGTKELGHLDLSIQISNKNLELKITAESDKAREMLSQELPALRQALLNQSLDLKTVEIGVSSDQQWSQSFQDNEGNRQHQFYEEQADQIIGSPPPSVNVRNELSSLLTKQKLGLHNGQIQLRV